MIQNIVGSEDEEERQMQRRKLETDLEITSERLEDLVQGGSCVRMYIHTGQGPCRSGGCAGQGPCRAGGCAEQGVVQGRGSCRTGGHACRGAGQGVVQGRGLCRAGGCAGQGVMQGRGPCRAGVHLVNFK